MDSEWLVPSSGCLANLKQSIRCAVVAIEGANSLYQVKQVPSKSGPEKMELRFAPVDRHGDVEEGNGAYLREHRSRILALNPNDRYLRLMHHIKTEVSASNLPLPLKHFIGEGEPVPVFYELESTVPKELCSLNEDQRLAGHPLCLKTAGEVAGCVSIFLVRRRRRCKRSLFSFPFLHRKPTRHRENEDHIGTRPCATSLHKERRNCGKVCITLHKTRWLWLRDESH